LWFVHHQRQEWSSKGDECRASVNDAIGTETANGTAAILSIADFPLTSKPGGSAADLPEIQKRLPGLVSHQVATRRQGDPVSEGNGKSRVIEKITPNIRARE
jgi:hypothetical protein